MAETHTSGSRRAPTLRGAYVLISQMGLTPYFEAILVAPLVHHKHRHLPLSYVRACCVYMANMSISISLKAGPRVRQRLRNSHQTDASPRWASILAIGGASVREGEMGGEGASTMVLKRGHEYIQTGGLRKSPGSGLLSVFFYCEPVPGGFNAIYVFFLQV